MKKQLIALRGPSSVGKSSTFQLLYKILLAHPETKPVRFESLGRKRDFLAIVSINGISVGMFNRGDVAETVRELLNRLVAERCQVIVCAARTKGTVEDVLGSLKRKYNLQQVEKEPKSGESESVSNASYAHDLAARIYKAVDA